MFDVIDRYKLRGILSAFLGAVMFCLGVAHRGHCGHTSPAGCFLYIAALYVVAVGYCLFVRWLRWRERCRSSSAVAFDD